MEPDYTDFSLNISEIWRIHCLFYRDEPEGKDRFILKLRSKLIQKIASMEEPFSSFHQNKELFNKIQKQEKEHVTLPEVLELNEFTHGFDIYQFFQKRLVSIEDLDFNYWFALKLETFKDEIRIIEYFLLYHLAITFEDDLEGYLKFLDITTDQFQDVFLSRCVVSRIDVFCVELEADIADEEDEQQSSSTSTKEKPTTKQYSLYLDIRNRKDDGSFLRTTRSAFFKVRESLVKQDFIDKKTSIEQLINMFNNQNIAFSNRVIWKCHMVSLKLFLEFFRKNELIVDLRNDFWRTAVACFKRKRKNATVEEEIYEEFDPRKVSTAKDGKRKRKDELYQILELFKPESSEK